MKEDEKRQNNTDEILYQIRIRLGIEHPTYALKISPLRHQLQHMSPTKR